MTNAFPKSSPFSRIFSVAQCSSSDKERLTAAGQSGILTRFPFACWRIHTFKYNESAWQPHATAKIRLYFELAKTITQNFCSML